MIYIISLSSSLYGTERYTVLGTEYSTLVLFYSKCEKP